MVSIIVLGRPFGRSALQSATGPGNRLTVALWRAFLPTALAAIVSTLAFAADSKPVEIPLANPGFEKGAEGWVVNEGRFPGMVTVDKTNKHAGEAALKIADLRGAADPYTAQSVKGLSGGAVYRWQAWFAGEKGKPAGAALKIEFYNAKGESTSGHYARLATRADGSWQQVDIIAPAGPDVTSASLLLRLFGKGTVYFDDCDFAMLREAPPLSLSPSRLAAAPKLKADLRLEIRLKPEAASDKPALTFTVQRASQREAPVPADLQPAEPGVFAATLHLPELTPGQYNIRCHLAKPQLEANAFLFVTPEKRKPEFLSDTGTILVGGKPFFPIGLYHVGPSDYAAVAAHGFNAVQGLPTLDPRVFNETLNTARTAGLMCDVPLYANGQVLSTMPISLQKLRGAGSHVSVLDWKIIDEPDLRPDVIDQVPSAYETLKKADPRHPLLLTIASPQSYDYWASFCDILQVDPYPIPTRPLTMVSDYAAKAKAALKPWQNLTVVLQCGWIGEPMNQPTFDQARCMVYLALINGAKGLFWYSLHDPGWDLAKTPLWTRFKELNDETRELSEPVMLGTAVEVKGIAAPLQGKCLEHGGKHYLLLANPGKDPVAAAVEVPFDVKQATARSKAEVKVEGRTLKLTIPGTGAEIVTVE